MEKRIIQLETLSALQDETIARLNEEIYRQQQDIGRVQRRLKLIEEKLAALPEPGGTGGNERPPHY